MEEIKTGILGLGAVSTLHYLKRLNEEYSKKKGGYSTFPSILVNADFNKINPYLPNQFKKLEDALMPYLNYFEEAGVLNLLMPNITIHETLDKILEHSVFSFSIVHPLQLMAAQLLRHSVKEIYLLGTMYTMESMYIADYFNKAGISCLSINSERILMIDKLRTKVYAGEAIDTIETDKYMTACFGSKKKLVIACTELSVLFSLFKSLSFYDMAEEQINFLIYTKQ